MRIELQEIKIENFKGVKSLALDFADGRCVRGDNGTGKTTIFDAVCWVLFDKDSKGAANSQIKPVDDSGAEVHNLESVVDAVFDVDGKTVRLRKSFQEKWTKKRGSATKTHEGHTTTYAVDEVPVPLKEYKANVAAIVEESVFKLLTNPYEFAGLHWKERRAILIKLAGDVSDADVIASNDELASLSSILGDRSLEDVKKILLGRRKVINKDLNDIPVRIQELNRAETPEAPDLETKAILEGKLAGFRDRLANETDAGALKEKELAIREIAAEILEIQNAAVVSPEKAEIEARISELESEFAQADSMMTRNGYQIDSMGGEKARLDTLANNLRAEWKTINADEFHADLVCPTCGQMMPEDSVEDARASFNSNKAQRLADINKRGKEASGESNALAEKLEAIKAANAKIRPDIENMQKEAQALRDRLPGLAPKVDNKAIELLTVKKSVIEGEIMEIKNGSATRRDSIKISIEETEAKISTIAAQEVAVKADKERIARVAELEEQERQLGLEFEETERQLHTMGLFIVSKVDMLESTINGRFKLATFKMFREQVNGGIEECCEILCGGVPFGRGLNTGASINTGLDIINTLSDYYGVKAPIFVDNCESVTQVIDTESQLIKLIVDPEAKTLTQAKE